MNTKLVFYGHAALELQVAGKHLLVDPYLNDNPVSPVKADQVSAEYILVTHGHGDHLGDTVSIAKRTGATVICNAEISGWLQKKGIKTHAQHIGGGFNYPFGYLKLTQALHGSELPDGSNGGAPAGFLLTTPEGKKIYLAGDTGLFGDMGLIGEEGLDLAVIPIGDNFTMGPSDAFRALKLLHPRSVIPIHYNTFGLIAQDAEAWAEKVSDELGIKATLLKPGEFYEVN